MSKSKFLFSTPSHYHFKRVEKSNQKSDVTNYELSNLKDECLVGLFDTNHIFKFVNLTTLSHSRFKLFVGTSEYSTPVNIPWKAFQIYKKDRIIFIQKNSPIIYETRIPVPQKKENSSKRSSIIERVNLIANHSKFVTQLKCCPNNQKLFLTSNEGGEFKLFHIIFKKSSTSNESESVPLTNCLWTYSPFMKRLDPISIPIETQLCLYTLKKKGEPHFYASVSDERGEMKCIDLRTKEIVSETLHSSNEINVIREARTSFGRTAVVCATGGKGGCVFIYNSTTLDLINTLYLGIEGTQCIINDVCIFTDYQTEHDILVAATKVVSKKDEKIKFSLKFVDLKTHELKKEFVYDDEVLFCKVVSRLERRKVHLIIGNSCGVLNAWNVDELLVERVKKEMKQEKINEEEEVVEEDDDDEMPVPLSNVPIPSPINSPSGSPVSEKSKSPKEVDSEVIIINERQRGKTKSPKNCIRVTKKNSMHNNKNVLESMELPRSVMPIPSSLHSSTSSAREIRRREKKGKKRSLLVRREKKMKRKRKKKIEKPVLKKLVISKEGKVIKNVNFGKPEEFMAVLHDETIRRTQKNDIPEHRFARRRVIDQKAFKKRIEEIQNKKFVPKKIEKTSNIMGMKRKKFKTPKYKFENLSSISVDKEVIEKQIRIKSMGNKKKKRKREYSPGNYSSTISVRDTVEDKMKEFSVLEELLERDFCQESFDTLTASPLIRLKPKSIPMFIGMSAINM